MASVKTVAELLLLSCLIFTVTSSPIQDKKKTLTPRTGRDFRTKTAGSSLQHPFLSSNRRVPDPKAPVAQFGSGLRPSSGVKTKYDQATRQNPDRVTSGFNQNVDKVSELADTETKQNIPSPDSATQTFRTRDSHSPLPAISNFGDRIHSNQNNAKSPSCNVKGGCSTANFTPDGGISVNGISSNTNLFQQDNRQTISDVHHDQQQQVAGPTESKATGNSQTGQNAYDTYPDYEGLISPHDFPTVKGGQATFVQDNQRHTDIVNTQIISANIPDHAGFDHQTQFVTQEDFSGRNQQSHENRVPVQEVSPIQPVEPSSSFESFPFEQSHQNVDSGINGHRNQERTSQFDQQHIPSSFDGSQDSLNQQHISNQPASPGFVQDNQGPLIQQQVNIQPVSPDFIPENQGPLVQPTSPDFIPDSQGHLNQDHVSGQQASQDFIPDSQGPFTQQQVSEEPKSSNFAPDSQGHLTQQQISGQPASQDFFPDSQTSFTQQQTSDHSSTPNFVPDSQGVLTQHQTSGQSASQDFARDSQGHFPQQQTGDKSDIPLEGHHQVDDGQYHHFGNPIDWLRYSVPGNPGEDYPIFYTVPQTSFDCKQQQFSAGIYGDMEASCQVFHICKEDGGQDSFLCPNGTVFNQQYFVCDWWYNFKCADTPSFYSLNADLYWDWDNFTPTQVLNGPAMIDDQFPLDFQTGSQHSFSNIPGRENGRSPVNEVSGQNNAVKSTIAIDNSAIVNKDRLIPEQVPEEHTFSDKQSSLFNEQKNQDYDQQVQKEFTPSFDDATRGSQPVTASPFDDGRKDQTIFPISSDTGANRQPGANAGSRYPDQVGNGHQSTSSFETHDQRTTAVNFEDSFANSDVGQKPIEQTFVTQSPDSFGSGNQFRDNIFTSNQNTQKDFGRDKTTTAQLDINQDISSGLGTHDGTYFTQTRDHATDTTRNQFPEQFITNNRNDAGGIGQVNQVQQEYIQTNFDNKPTTLGAVDQSFSLKDENLYIRSERPTTGQQDFSTTGVTQNIPSSGFTTDIQNTQRNLDVQNQITVNFDSKRQNNFQDQNLGGIFTQNENTVFENTRTTPFDRSIIGNTGNIGTGIRQEDQRVQQEHITSSFDVGNQNPQDTGNFQPGPSFDNDQTFPGSQNNIHTRNFNRNENAGQGYTPQELSGDSRGNTNDYYDNKDTQTETPLTFQTDSIDSSVNNNAGNQNVQQEYVPAFDEENVPSTNERPASFGQTDNNQGQTVIPFQPQGGSVIRDQFQDGNQGGNHEIRQDHVPVSFDQQTINPFNRDGNNNVPGIDQGNIFTNANQRNLNTRNNQVITQTDEQYIPNQFDNRQPEEINKQQTNGFDSGVGDSSPYDHTNKNIHQENIVFPFDGNSQNTFIPENNNDDHTNKNIHQENIVFPFNGNSQNTFIPGNNNENRNNFNNVPQQQTPFSGNGQLNNNLHQNTGPLNPEHQQHSISENSQKDVPGTFVGDNQNMYDKKDDTINPNEPQYNIGAGNVNIDQNSQFGISQQNNFGPFLNGDRSNFQGQQVFRQEHVAVNFNNNYENRDQNSFNQDNNYRPIQNQIQNNYQGNLPSGGNSGSHQNANEAFQIRLNNFQPANIHLMNRGQFQKGNFQQERVSFRPYGQNVPNAITFPENGPLILVANQENNAAPNYNNNKGSSNRNFFVTNGHQVHGVGPISQQPNNQGFSNEQPINNVQDVNQYGSQDFNQVQFNNNPVTYDRNQAEAQNTAVNQQGPFTGNNVANSGIKGNFYRRSLDTTGPLTADINPRGYPTVSTKADDVNRFSQAAPESPNSMTNNGWKPVVKQ